VARPQRTRDTPGRRCRRAALRLEDRSARERRQRKL